MKKVSSSITTRCYFGERYYAEIKSLDSRKEYTVSIFANNDIEWHRFRVYDKFKSAYEYAQRYLMVGYNK